MSISPLALSCVFLFLGAVTIIGGIRTLSKVIVLLNRGVPAAACIINFEGNGEDPTPILQYRTVQGEVRQARCSVVFVPAWKMHQVVPIVYDPRQLTLVMPAKYRVLTLTMLLFLVGFGGLCLFIGLSGLAGIFGFIPG